MPRLAYFDCFNGAAGDMIVGALLDAGGDFAQLQAALAPLLRDRATIALDRVVKNGIACAKYRVRVVGDAGGAPDESHVAVDPGFSPGEHGRTLAAVLAVVATATIPARAAERAAAVFRRLAEAEAAVHGASVDDVHFHEVGAIDAIADVVGACFLLDALGIDVVRASPLPIGRGMVRAAHGLLSVPTPATVKLLRGVPTYDNGQKGELVTPTGAALLSTLASSFGGPPTGTIRASGYGAGDRDHPDVANAVRVVVYDAVDPASAPSTPSTSTAPLTTSAPSSSLQAAPSPSSASSPVSSSPSSWAVGVDLGDAVVERLAVVEANVDDATGQQLAYVVERLFAAGARDAWTTPIVMKKGRPAATVHALVDPDRVGAALDALFAQGATLGARVVGVDRVALARQDVVVTTPWGDVPVKRATWRGRVVRAEPEHDVCARLATQHGVALVDVQRAAAAAARTSSAA